MQSDLVDSVFHTATHLTNLVEYEGVIGYFQGQPDVAIVVDHYGHN